MAKLSKSLSYYTLHGWKKFLLISLNQSFKCSTYNLVDLGGKFIHNFYTKKYKKFVFNVLPELLQLFAKNATVPFDLYAIR